MRIKTVMAVTSLMLAAPALAADAAQDPASSPSPAAEARPAGGNASSEEVRTLREEIRRLKLEMGLGDVEYKSHAGMGPAASKVYYAPKGLSIGGYGEAFYENALGASGAGLDNTDMLRVVLYAGYRFSNRIVFNSEVEFEHGGHEIGVEFAYLDFLLAESVNLRLGNVLVPVGFVNEMHEPPFFHGVDRPFTERNLIPSTWNENGAGVYGDLGPVRYKAYVLGGLDAIGRDEALQASSWVRRARTGGAEARAETFAGVGSLSYAAGPALVGASLYRGQAGQHDSVNDVEVDADVTIAEAHAGFTWEGLQLRGLFTLGWLGDADLVSASYGLNGDAVLGSRVHGGYAEAAYDVMRYVARDSQQSLSPFVRYERVDLHDQVPAGGVRSGSRDQTFWTAGVTYKPLPTVVLKADYQRMDSQADDFSNQVNVGAGFVF